MRDGRTTDAQKREKISKNRESGSSPLGEKSISSIGELDCVRPTVDPTSSADQGSNKVRRIVAQIVNNRG